MKTTLLYLKLKNRNRNFVNDNIVLRLLNKKIATEFKRKPSEVIGGRLMLFGDFMDIGTDDKKYIEIVDQEEVSWNINLVNTT